jgi:hypothetical protein
LEDFKVKISGRYSPGLYAGVTGFLLLVAINALSIPEELKQTSGMKNGKS